MDLDFFERRFRAEAGRPLRRLREDFCGSALLAATWAARGRGRRAWGVDDDPLVIRRAAARRIALGAAARRLVLERRDVRRRTRPRVDLICALNFSWWVFHSRAALRGYFARARASLRPRGLLVLGAFGGGEAMRALTERRRVAASTGFEGGRVPAFTYVWEQARFDPISHRLLAHVHFQLGPRRTLRRAFSYDWRLWTLPETRELLAEAGFRRVSVHSEDWIESRGHYRFPRRTRLRRTRSWFAYVVAAR